MPGGRAERRRGRTQRGGAGAAVEKRKGAASPAGLFGHRKRAAKRFKSFCPCQQKALASGVLRKEVKRGTSLAARTSFPVMLFFDKDKPDLSVQPHIKCSL